MIRRYKIPALEVASEADRDYKAGKFSVLLPYVANVYDIKIQKFGL
jgi:hypothetical protein